MKSGLTPLDHGVASKQDDELLATHQHASTPWPENPSPLRLRLTDFTRAHRVAQRMFEHYGEPVVILQQGSAIQSHCLVWGQNIYKLKLHTNEASPCKLVTAVF